MTTRGFRDRYVDYNEYTRGRVYAKLTAIVSVGVIQCTFGLKGRLETCRVAPGQLVFKGCDPEESPINENETFELIDHKVTVEG